MDFGETVTLFSFVKMLHTILNHGYSIYIPINNVQEFPFSTLVIFHSFDNKYSYRDEVIAYGGFDLHFPDD